MSRAIDLDSVLVRADVYIAGLSILLGSCGGVLLIVGLGSSNDLMAMIGAAFSALGVLLIFAGRWIDPFAVLVFCLPLPAVFSSASLRIAPPVIVTSLIILTHAGSLIGAEPGRRRADNEFTTLGWLAFGIGFAVLVSAIQADARGVAIRELINWCLLLGLLIIVARELHGRPDRILSLAVCLGVAAGIAGCFAILQFVGLIPATFAVAGGTVNRATLGFGWPNELGMYFALSIPFSVMLVGFSGNSGQRILAVAGLAAAVLGLVGTLSRGSWIAVIVASLVFLTVGERAHTLRIWLAAAVAVVLADVITGGAIRDRITSTIGDWVVEQRAALTLAGVHMFFAQPWLGVGPGGFGESLAEYGPGVTWLWDYVATAQNAYVQMAAETGVLGFATLTAFLGTTLTFLIRGMRRARRSNATTIEISLRRALLWSFAVACAIGFVEWSFAHGPAEIIIFVAAMTYALGTDSAGMGHSGIRG